MQSCRLLSNHEQAARRHARHELPRVGIQGVVYANCAEILVLLVVTAAHGRSEEPNIEKLRLETPTRVTHLTFQSYLGQTHLKRQSLRRTPKAYFTIRESQRAYD